jgi:hypothetical protein
MRPASSLLDVASSHSFRLLQPAPHAAPFSSTSLQKAANVVILNKVPRGTTVDSLKSALPFPVVDLFVTGASLRDASVPSDPFSLSPPPDRDTRFRAVLDNAEAARSAVTHVEHNPISVNGSELRLTQQQDMPPSPELYVTGFPGSTDHAELAHALGVPPDIVRLRTGRNGPFTNITFSNVEEAKEAMARFAASPSKLGEHILDVSYSRRAALATRLYVSGMQGTVNCEQLAAALGVPTSAVIPPNFGSTSFHAHIQFPSVAAAEILLARHRIAPMTVDGAELKMEFAGRPLGTPSARLKFVGLADDVGTLRKLLTPIESLFEIDSTGPSLSHYSSMHG